MEKSQTNEVITKKPTNHLKKQNKLLWGWNSAAIGLMFYYVNKQKRGVSMVGYFKKAVGNDDEDVGSEAGASSWISMQSQPPQPCSMMTMTMVVAMMRIFTCIKVPIHILDASSLLTLIIFRIAEIGMQRLSQCKKQSAHFQLYKHLGSLDNQLFFQKSWTNCLDNKDAVLATEHSGG